MGILEKMKAVAGRGQKRISQGVADVQRKRVESEIEEENYRAIERAAARKTYAQEMGRLAEERGKVKGIRVAMERSQGKASLTKKIVKKIVKVGMKMQMPDLWGDMNPMGSPRKKKKK